MNKYLQIVSHLKANPRTWLVTGAAGFIGSHLVETLLEINQKVVGLDNFSTGHKHNLDAIYRKHPEKFELNFKFIEGDIRDLPTCNEACENVSVILHQAALGSVPRSIENPLMSHQSNVDGFINMLAAAKERGVNRFVFASSSSVYGDHPLLPKVENLIGQPLSPYAATKYIDEVYANVFAKTYGLETIGLRYFNIFGPRQDPNGPYAAVIPRWITSIQNRNPVIINGDGQTSRDFCFVKNAVQANILAACSTCPDSVGTVYNVACSQQTSLRDLFEHLRNMLSLYIPAIAEIEPVYNDFRPGDIHHSLADISKAKEGLGYEPTHYIIDGLQETVSWFINARS